MTDSLEVNLTMVRQVTEGGLVLGLRGDGLQEGEMQEEDVLNTVGVGKHSAGGLVDYEEDYQHDDREGDILPDPGLTIDYEEEVWDSWQQGLRTGSC